MSYSLIQHLSIYILLSSHVHCPLRTATFCNWIFIILWHPKGENVLRTSSYSYSNMRGPAVVFGKKWFGLCSERQVIHVVIWEVQLLYLVANDLGILKLRMCTERQVIHIVIQEVQLLYLVTNDLDILKVRMCSERQVIHIVIKRSSCFVFGNKWLDILQHFKAFHLISDLKSLHQRFSFYLWLHHGDYIMWLHHGDAKYGLF